jgi:phosphopantetheinyl transferase
MESRFTLHSPEGGWLRIEPLALEHETLPLVSEEDRRRAAELTSPERRRETLAWRALLYRELGMIPITYAPCGAPELPQGEGFIGVSHSRTQVALCYCPQAPCAVDIEREDRHFERIKSRYLTSSEQQLSHHPAYLCIAWCAKECLYKLARRRELDLLRDLQLLKIQFTTPEQGAIECRLLDQYFTLNFRHIDPEWAVWKL